MACKVCEAISKKENLVYEDDLVVILMGETVEGHLKVYPKKHVQKVQELDEKEFNRLFTSASLASTMVFEALGGMQAGVGTNMMANSSSMTEHLCIDVVPRKMDDGLKLQWEPQELSEDDTKDASTRIKDKCDFIGKEKPKQEVVEEKAKSELDEEHPMVKHLRRVP
ncbi:HIT domain-containing protein [Candidatus Woesearchaeota archaeon]|nr:HIT domain-containing protein [Candidatus Woesearchaeota archaeon]